VTLEEQQITIGEHLGWKRGNHTFLGYDVNGSELWVAPDGQYGYKELPNYPNDLNDMHEAEKLLTAKQKREYRNMLCIVCGQNHPSWHATASQRAESFLRVVGKWKD